MKIQMSCFRYLTKPQEVQSSYFQISRHVLENIVHGKVNLADFGGIEGIQRSICTSLQDGIDTEEGMPHIDVRRAYYGSNGFKKKRKSSSRKQLQGSVRVKVIRNRGKRLSIPICELVVGDIVQLCSQDTVPADGLFFILGENTSLSIKEPNSDLSEQITSEAPHIQRGSIVQQGFAMMMVTAVEP